MRLRVILPSETLVDESVSEVAAEGPQGRFCLLPRHVDYVTGLVPGILSYLAKDGGESFLALNGGLLVKQGPEVMVSTRQAVTGTLGELEVRVRGMLGEVDEKERVARAAVARLEADFVRRFMGFGHG
ncbi:MAG: F0F1 ATP synthase subunit epsilon [Desulfovibrionaceae bacterium]|nr:F0F1 ATP synthase subunit epsilon [Desulfovibrionaceae bacterium]